MNFSDLPGSHWSWGFVGLLGVMALLAVGLWLYFVRRGFIGGPRLRDLPRSVGLGLVHIGMVPLRAASSVLPGTGRNRAWESRPPSAEGNQRDETE
jgi:hypothetical protein